LGLKSGKAVRGDEEERLRAAERRGGEAGSGGFCMAKP